MAKKSTTTEATKTAGIADRLKQIVQEEIEHLPELLEQLTPDVRAKTLLELLAYCAPKYDKKKPQDDEGDLWAVPSWNPII